MSYFQHSHLEQEATNLKFTGRILGEVPSVKIPEIIIEIWEADESIVRRKYTVVKLYKKGKK